jgi:hypothetical protein
MSFWGLLMQVDVCGPASQPPPIRITSLQLSICISVTLCSLLLAGWVDTIGCNTFWYQLSPFRDSIVLPFCKSQYAQVVLHILTLALPLPVASPRHGLAVLQSQLSNIWLLRVFYYSHQLHILSKSKMRSEEESVEGLLSSLGLADYLSMLVQSWFQYITRNQICSLSFELRLPARWFLNTSCLLLRNIDSTLRASTQSSTVFILPDSSNLFALVKFLMLLVWFFRALQEITEEDLAQMQVKRGHRRVLQRALGKVSATNGLLDPNSTVPQRLELGCSSHASVSRKPVASGSLMALVNLSHFLSSFLWGTASSWYPHRTQRFLGSWVFAIGLIPFCRYGPEPQSVTSYLWLKRYQPLW